MPDRAVGILTLSAAKYLDRAAGADKLHWTVPCAYVGAHVAFVAQGRLTDGGQRI